MLAGPVGVRQGRGLTSPPVTVPTIPASELRFTFVRSSGAGGQNVNKVSSKAVLRWSPAASQVLGEDVKARLFERYGSRLAADGDLILTSDRHRDQGSNSADCITKLRALIATVLTPPTPRKATRPTRGSRRRRLQGKKEQSEKKEGRRKPGPHD